jgi:hypothetical protein
MIPFFRKIRKKMADDNRPLKYARYAIGEIVLVVIGILIALQINTWNEERKVKIEEQKILKDLRVEIASNIKLLEGVTEYHQLGLKHALILQDYMWYPEKLSEISGDSILRLTFNLVGKIYYPEKGILNSALTSGQINSIENKNLKYLLASLNDLTLEKMELSNIIFKDGKDYLFKLAYPKVVSIGINNVYNSYDHDMYKHIDYRNLYKVPEFIVALNGYFVGNREQAITYEMELKKIYEEVLVLIDHEIKLE